MYKYFLGIIAIVLVSVGTAWLLMKPDVQEKTGEVVAPPEISPTPIAFISTEDGESVFVTFGTSTALLSGKGYSNVLLTQVEAASGAKYESEAENLVVWNKESEITITRGRKVIFSGLTSDGGTTTLSATTTATTAESTSTSSLPLSGQWLWVETIKGEATIIPKTAGVFLITFTEDTISGTTDCNGFNGTYTKNDNVITVGALATTKMFCEGSQEMEFTQQFIGSLTATRLGTQLILTHTDGTVSRFEAK